MELAFGAKEFFDNFLIYHYLFFGFLFLFGILLLVLGIVAKRSSFFSFLFYFGSFTSLFVGPFVGSYYLEEYLRGTKLEDVKVARLSYTKAIVLTAKMTNIGRAPISKSYVLTTLVKRDPNSIKEFINILRPAKVHKVSLDAPLKGKESMDIRVVMDISDVKNPSTFDLYYQIKSF